MLKIAVALFALVAATYAVDVVPTVGFSTGINAGISVAPGHLSVGAGAHAGLYDGPRYARHAYGGPYGYSRGYYAPYGRYGGYHGGRLGGSLAHGLALGTGLGVGSALVAPAIGGAVLSPIGAGALGLGLGLLG